MRIGIDARFYSIAGPGRYEKNLIKELEKLDKQNDYFIFLRKANFEKYQPQNQNFKKVLTDYPWYSFKEQIFMPLEIAKTKADLMHFPHFNIPLLYFGPFVLTIHDLIMHEFSTESATTRNLLYYRFKRLVYKIIVWWAVKRAQKIFVPSKATKTDLIKIPGVSEKKIVVTYEGVDEKFNPEAEQVRLSRGVRSDVLEKYGIKKPYLFYLGSMYPHKNVESLIEAFKILKEKYNFKGQLILVGKKDYFSKRIKEELTVSSMAEDIIFPGLLHEDGYLPDEEAVEIFKQAEMFVFPSLKEGFGLPLLEAMSLGVPVAASDISSILEICQEAVYYFNPRNVEEMALRINELLTDNDLRRRLVEKGIKQAGKFSWEKMAVETLKFYQSFKRESLVANEDVLDSRL